jgi:hypothetical protein
LRSQWNSHTKGKAFAEAKNGNISNRNTGHWRKRGKRRKSAQKRGEPKG